MGNPPRSSHNQLRRGFQIHDAGKKSHFLMRNLRRGLAPKSVATFMCKIYAEGVDFRPSPHYHWGVPFSTHFWMTQRKPYLNWVRREPSVNRSGFRFSVSRTKQKPREGSLDLALGCCFFHSAWKNRAHIFRYGFF